MGRSLEIDSSFGKACKIACYILLILVSIAEIHVSVPTATPLACDPLNSSQSFSRATMICARLTRYKNLLGNKRTWTLEKTSGPFTPEGQWSNADMEPVPVGSFAEITDTVPGKLK